MQQIRRPRGRRPITFRMYGCLAVGILGTALIGGCSSGGTYPVDLTATPQPTQSPAPQSLAGPWSGPFTVSNGRSGLAGITVGSDGAVTGIVIGTTDEEEGTVTGTIDSQGNASITFRDDQNRITFSGTGVLSVNSAGQLTGTLTRFVNGAAAGSANVTLNRGQLASCRVRLAGFGASPGVSVRRDADTAALTAGAADRTLR